LIRWLLSLTHSPALCTTFGPLDSFSFPSLLLLVSSLLCLSFLYQLDQYWAWHTRLTDARLLASHPAMSTSTTSSTSHHSNVVPSEVGWQFVPQYYTFVNKEPHRLHCFYSKNSTFIHGTEGEEVKPCYGQQVGNFPSKALYQLSSHYERRVRGVFRHYRVAEVHGCPPISLPLPSHSLLSIFFILRSCWLFAFMFKIPHLLYFFFLFPSYCPSKWPVT